MAVTKKKEDVPTLEVSMTREVAEELAEMIAKKVVCLLGKKGAIVHGDRSGK